MSITILVSLFLLACLGLMTVAQAAVDVRGRLRRWLRPLASETLSGGVVRSLMLLALIPGVALTLLLAGKRLGDKEDNERAIVDDGAASAAAQVDAFLERHVAGIRSAAEAIALDGRPSADRLGQWLLRYHPIYPDFLTMLVTDSSGQVVTASKREGGQPALVTSNENVSDRAYFRTPMSGGGDYVSPAFRGRGLGTDPLVAISSRIDVGGRSIGIVEGSLNLMAFKRLDTSYQRLLNARVVLLDASGVVVYADPATGYTFLNSVRGEPLGNARQSTTPVVISNRHDGVQLWAGHARSAHGWSVLVLKPKATLEQTLASEWWVALVWLGVCALFAVALSWALARRVSIPMRRLVGALDHYHGEPRSPFRSIARLPQEYRIIFRHLHGFVVRQAMHRQRLVRALKHAGELQSELSRVLQEREIEIQQRTRELAAANEELEQLSRTDVLTQLANRRGFEEEFERMWHAATRAQEPLAIVLIDVDLFKLYNDSYGHPAGDRVLAQVARAIHSSLHRPGDLAARYGGEEFAVVLGNTSCEGAIRVAERIRVAVQSRNIDHRGSPHGCVTVSVGVASACPRGIDERSAALGTADKMLYEAKSLGRNRVTHSQFVTRPAQANRPASR